MLQCHPYPYEYADTSKECAHCAFFMGLQRKQGVRVKEGQQFDIRGTVDEFREDVNMYMYWKPGMVIYVSHVRRKQLPSYVFPEGYKRPRRNASQQVGRMCDDADGDSSGSIDRRLKRRTYSDAGDVAPSRLEKRASISPQRLGSLSPEVSSRFCGPSPLRSGELVKLPVDMKSDDLPLIKQDSSDSYGTPVGGNEAGTADAILEDLSGKDTPASLDICNRIKGACLAGKNEESTEEVASMTFENTQTESFRTAKDLIERAAKNAIDEVMARCEPAANGVKSGILFGSDANDQTVNHEVS